MPRTPASGRTTQDRFNLITGEDSYAGQNAQNPLTARKLQSWIPTDDGQLHRELPEPTYLATTLSGPVVGLYEFVQNTGNGAVTRYYFAAARTDFVAGTKTCNLYKRVGAAWVVVSNVGTLTDAPMCVTQQNNFYVADGTSNWLFNGTVWVPVGFTLFPGVPQNTASLTFPVGTNGPAVSASQAAAPPIVFSGSVQQKYIHSLTSGSAGSFGYYYPQTSFDATATGSSVLFNPPQMGNGVDPNIQPMKQAVVNSSGVITSYATPDASANTDYAMMVIFSLVIPAAGTYDVQINHDDAIVWGISNGATHGQTPSASGPSYDLYNHAQTAVNGYGKVGGGILVGGTNKQGNYSENFSVTFPKADTYTIEIDYSQHINAQQLTFLIAAQGQSLTFPYPGTATPVAGFSAVIGRQYWITTSDQTAGVETESDSSAPSASTGPVNFASVSVYPTGGHFTCTSGSKTVTVASDSTTGQPWSDGNGTESLLAKIVGKSLWINGTLIGKIASYTITGSLNYLATITLVANSASSITSGYAVIADARTTHWNLYASESDGSKIGQLLATVPVTQNLKVSPFTDVSPFLDDTSNSFLPVFRPVRNDPPPASRILEVHKIRQWRRRESSPNFFNFTANEEVTSGDNGDATQCVPGADSQTISDMVNEVSFPDQSARLRGLISHTDALYMFSEKQCYPLYGQSVDDFAISQTVAFSLGLAGRFAAKSTPHGLFFVSYDRRVFLYPSSPYGTYLAQSGSAASALKEIGKPMRNKFLQMSPARLDEVVVAHYHFGVRDWLVVSFPDVNGVYQCFAYDVNTSGWFQLQKGFGAIAAFEISEGEIALVGGAIDGKVYVIDDQTGTYSTSGTLPISTYRPALIDFGDSEHAHVFRSVEIETDSAAMAKDLTVTYWLDPNSVDSPGTGKTLTLRPTLGANRFRAFPEGGSTCQRMLIEFKAKASTNGGVIRGLKLSADTAPGYLPSNQAGGV